MDNYGQYNNRIPPPQMYWQPDLIPSREEKKKIRHNYNVIGIVLIVLLVLGTAAARLLYKAFAPVTTYNSDGAMVLNLAETLIGGYTPAVTAILVFAGYCLFARYDPKELFSTRGLDGKQIFRYVLMVLGLQQASFICTMIMSNMFYSAGLVVYTTNYVLEHSPQVYIADIISSVIIAPIGEELIYRGVVLRCAAKVSQRFAIFFSAFVFGIMHGNPYQFVLGFLLGIPMAIITIKTGSLIPSIVCHMVNNLMASAVLAVQYFDEAASLGLDYIMLPIFLILGIIVLVSEAATGRMRLPEYTAFHKKRTLPILITSWSMILVTVFYVYELISSVVPIADIPAEPEVTGETVRLFIERILI